MRARAGRAERGQAVTGRGSREEAAHQYAEVGWPVFPARPGGKEPLIPRAHSDRDPQAGRCRGECGREGHGLYDAATDHAQIERWWSRDPEANVAIATGAPGPDVVDVDVKGDENGFAAWNRLKQAGLVAEPQAIVTTPGRGIHAYFAGSEQGNGTLRAHHIDFRGKGGYVIAPPSDVDGRPYVVARHQAATASVDWQEIRRHLDPQPQRHVARWQASADGMLDRLAGWLSRRGPGDRNFATFYAAKQLAIAGQLDGPAKERLLDAALSAGLRGGEREARASIASGERSAAREATSPGRRPFDRAPEREAG
jgi:hypothetical protein